jgi:uncharacterized membrane protein
MKNYLREIEISGVILMLIGCISYRFLQQQWGIYACSIGLILWVIEVVYKAFNWKKYERDNKQNIIMMLFVIVMLFTLILSR